MQTRQPSSRSSVAELWVTAESAGSEPGEPITAIADDGLIGMTLLGTYAVDRVMDEGGMGRIYEAHHTRLEEKRYAIKVLRPELHGSAHSRARFAREAEAVAHINHPGVVSIVDVGTTALGLPFMVCEHLNGLDLRVYLRRFGALKEDRAVHMGCRVAEALEASHAQGVIHRDIKPSNIFLLGAFEPLGPEWDRVKIIDFGLSRFVGRDDQLTKAGLVMGTPAYMSPEQAQGGRTDHLTDVYGVGAVLYTAATGVPPFREETQQQTLLAVLTRDAVRPRELNPSISEGLEIVIQRAMAKRPADRHSSMSALRLELSNLELGQRARSSGRRISVPTASVRGVRLRFMALLGSALVLGMAALASVAMGLGQLMGLGAEDLELSTTERVLLVAVLSTMAGMLALKLLRSDRHAWANSARLSDRLPKLRVPMASALALYGLASFALRFGDDVVARLGLAGGLAGVPATSWPGWGPLLALVGLIAAGGVALHQSWWPSARPLLRWGVGVSLALGVVLAWLTLAYPGFLRQSLDGAMPGTPDGALTVDPTAPEAAPNAGFALPRDAGASPVPGALRVPGVAADAGAGLADAAAPEVTLPERAAPEATLPRATLPQALVIEATVPEAKVGRSEVGTASAPVNTPAVATPPAALGSSASSSSPPPPAREVTREVQGLRPSPNASVASPAAEPARAAAPPSSPDLLASVRRIERQLVASPDRRRDPEVRRVLLQAARSDGDASREALEVLGRSMGRRGPDLLYELMIETPALAEPAKYQLSRFRVRALFSPELSIAYDLHFAPSCGSRIALLPRVEAIGDQRAVNELSRVITRPPRCDSPGEGACAAPCERDAARFARSIDVITRRLRASPR